jgi:predicted membrane channel-forming protein YqfA (hemolysin III family)
MESRVGGKMSPKLSQVVGIVLGIAGVVIVTVSTLADQIGLGRVRGYLGRYQYWAICFGMVVLVVAAVFYLLGAPPTNGD